MTRERWDEVQRVFHEVVERPLEEREAALDAACADDPDLRAEVASLLEADGADLPFLPADADAPPLFARALARTGPERDPVLDGATVGPYRILREIGRGGMGRVYLAERDDGRFERRVALKLVRAGLADDLQRRFRAERQILATLEHPGIARLYDGGRADDGRPYLAMEYVEGRPLTAYADDERLGVDARLRLFLRVAGAVAYAHSRLVVHRDLKPSNVLVTDGGEVRLLDFGIAKLLDGGDEEGALTRTGARLMTPEYAAPEQIRGETITTATDVYALGVVLYELLVGQRPFRADSDFAVAQAVLEEEPPRPSTAATRPTSGAARGDPPEVVSERRATTPDRLRRRLRGDLDAILLKALRKEPEARYASAEALAEDVQRHLDGLPVAARQGTRAYHARAFVRRHRWGIGAAALVLVSLLGGLAVALWQAREAARERDTAREVADFTETLLSAADPNAPDSERLDTLRVRDLLDRGARQVRAELGGQPQVQATLLDLLGDVNVNLGRYEEAEPLYRDALAIRQRVHGHDAPETAETRLGLAQLAFNRGDFEEAQAVRVEAVRALRSAGRPRLLAEAHNDLALSHQYDRDFVDAEREFRAALRVLREAGLGEDPYAAEVLNNTSILFYDQGDYERAEPLVREAYGVLLRHYGPDHPSVGIALNGLAGFLELNGNVEEAEQRFHEALDIFVAAYGTDAHTHVSTVLSNLALLYGDQKRFGQAEAAYRRAVAAEREVAGPRHPNVGFILRNQGLTLHDADRSAEAEPILREALAIFEEAFPDGHLYLYATQTALARVLTALGELPEADRLLRVGQAGLEEELPEDHSLRRGSQRDRGIWLIEAGRHEEAERVLLANYAAQREANGDDDLSTLETAEALVALYEAWGRPREAARYRR